MMITYGLTEEVYDLEGTLRTSYGIVAYADAEPDGTATVVVSVHDITSDKQQLAQLILVCNELALSPTHLDDVVEDFLNQ